MRDLHIIVNNKIATYLSRDGNIVCRNKDYQIVFSFDSEWDAYGMKVARFIWNDGYRDIPFTGNAVVVPEISNTKELEVGVYAGELSTTTPAVIPCMGSILCKHGLEKIPEPTPELYQQILAECGMLAARVDNLATLKEGSTTGDAELQDIRVGYDGKSYSSAGKAVREQVGSIASCFDITETSTHGKNLLNLNAPMPDPDDVYSGGFLRQKIFSDAGVISNNTSACITDYIAVTPGVQYICSSFYTGEQYRMEARRVIGYDDSKTLVGLIASYSYSFTIPEGVSFVRIQFALDRAEVNGQVEVGKNITEYEPYVTPDINRECALKPECLPEETKEKLEMLSEARDDIAYKQKPNLYDGVWELGRYDYNTGAKFETTNHVRAANPIKLDPSKRYNVQLKAGYRGSVYIHAFDATGAYMGYTDGVDRGSVTGAAAINIFVGNYPSSYPNEPLHLMVWEAESETETYAEWLEYGETGSYYQTKLLVKGEQLSDGLLAHNKARFDDSFNYIAYSEVAGSSGSINTAEHFKWAAKQGFTALKGDVRPTSDGGLIMCHDAGFTLADGKIASYDATNSVTIRSMTEAQCLNLQHAKTGNHVCNFETYIRICKTYGKIAFITIRDEYMEDVVPAMFEILDKYSMRKRCIVNSFTIASLRAVRDVDGDIMLSNVIGYEAVPTVANVEAVKALGNCLLNTFTFPGDNGFSCLEQGAEALAYARENDIRIYAAQTDSASDVDTLLQYGITGAQMLVAPNFD